MKPCPYCRQAPRWHYCRNVSRAREADHYLLEGCIHIEEFAKKFGFLNDEGRTAFEPQWDVEAERLLAVYTARWTEPQRVAFRTRVFAEKVETELPLTPDAIAETKEWSEAHPASKEDF